jgi:hypothetical protein
MAVDVLSCARQTRRDDVGRLFSSGHADVVGLEMHVDHVEAVSPRGSAGTLGDRDARRGHAHEGGADGGPGELNGSARVPRAEVGECRRRRLVPGIGDPARPAGNLVAGEESVARERLLTLVRVVLRRPPRV